jgi:molybdopterin/thiamine biosynthesis adenylyltransferase
MSSRYARHALIPGWDQQRLNAAQVVILGVGALGSETARLLAQAGVHRLVLCDKDVVEESNLSRGALFAPDDIGRSKVSAAAQALATLCPDTLVTQRMEWLVSGVGLAELRDATLVISCLDTRGARVQLARRCGLAGAAMLDGGTRPWGGEVRFYPTGGPCYGCGLTVSQRVQVDDRLSCTRPDETGASAAVSALIASWLATAALRIIFGHRVRAGILRIDAGNGETHRIRQPRDPGCPLHERIPIGLVEPSPLTWEATAAELVNRLSPQEAALGWTEFADPAQPFGIWLSNAPQAAKLRDLGVAPREIIRIITRSDGQQDRFIELAGEPAGGGR